MLYRFHNFLKSQIKDLKKKGFPGFLQKCYTLFSLLVAPGCVLLIRVLRPFLLIRFGNLSSRIGHLAACTELYMCERESSARFTKTVDIFYFTPPICNYQLKKMLERKLHILNFTKWVDRLNRLIPGGKSHAISLEADLDTRGFLIKNPIHLSFTAAEEQLGLQEMSKLGIPRDAKFVCFYARDPDYLNIKLRCQNWDYHNYRDSDIKNYIPAMQQLIRRGYIAVRMGAVIRDPLRDFNDKKIIDYATNGRTDFLDIFLSSKCHFFISSTGGLNAVPRIFRRPIAYVNFLPMGIKHIFSNAPGSLFIPKKLKWLNKNRILGLSEIINLGIDAFYRTEEYEQLGIEVIENTTEEISAIALEMDERLKGSWEIKSEDEQLQRRFWSLLKRRSLEGEMFTRIGTEFLRQNQGLLK